MAQDPQPQRVKVSKKNRTVQVLRSSSVYPRIQTLESELKQASDLVARRRCATLLSALYSEVLGECGAAPLEVQLELLRLELYYEKLAWDVVQQCNETQPQPAMSPEILREKYGYNAARNLEAANACGRAALQPMQHKLLQASLASFLDMERLSVPETKASFKLYQRIAEVYYRLLLVTTKLAPNDKAMQTHYYDEVRRYTQKARELHQTLFNPRDVTANQANRYQQIYFTQTPPDAYRLRNVEKAFKYWSEIYDLPEDLMDEDFFALLVKRMTWGESQEKSALLCELTFEEKVSVYFLIAERYHNLARLAIHFAPEDVETYQAEYEKHHRMAMEQYENLIEMQTVEEFIPKDCNDYEASCTALRNEIENALASFVTLAQKPNCGAAFLETLMAMLAPVRELYAGMQHLPLDRACDEAVTGILEAWSTPRLIALHKALAKPAIRHFVNSISYLTMQQQKDERICYRARSGISQEYQVGMQVFQVINSFSQCVADCLTERLEAAPALAKKRPKTTKFSLRHVFLKPFSVSEVQRDLYYDPTYWESCFGVKTDKSLKVDSEDKDLILDFFTGCIDFEFPEFHQPDFDLTAASSHLTCAR